MKKFTKGVKGSISLFLSMIILLLVILEGFLIDGSKVLAGKMKLANAGDLALNAGLTYYDEALRDIYGLFAISESEDELKTNLEAHIRRTLGETVGEADGAYVDQILDFADKAIQGEFNGVPQGKLLNMTMEEGSLSVGKLPSSVLSNEYVMKQQILEYMKYRGPASLGYGILEKLNMFKDMSSQQDAMEKKLDYEEKLSDIEELCEKVYKALNPDGETSYNGLLENALEPGSLESTSLIVNQHIYRAIQGTWCYSLLMRDFNLDTNWNRDNGYSGKDVESCIDDCSLLGTLSLLEESARANLNSADMRVKIQGGMAAAQTALGYIQEYDKYCTLYTAMKNYKEDYDKECKKIEKEIEELEKEDEPDEDAIEELNGDLENLEKEYKRVKGEFEKAETVIDDVAEILDFSRNQMKEAINSEINNARNSLKMIIAAAEELKERAQDGQKAITDLKKGMEDVEAAGKEWNNKIEALSDGDVKTSMKSDYVSESKTLDREKIDQLNERLINGEKYADQILTSIENTKAINYEVVNGGNDAAEKMRENFDSSVYGNDTISAVGSGYYNFDRESYIKDALLEPYNGALSDSSITVYWVETPGGGQMSGIYHKMDLSAIRSNMDNISAKNDEFYKYLERTCKQGDTDDNAKNDAEESKKTLLDKGNTDFSIDDINVTLNKGEETDSAKFEETDTNADDKEVSQKAKENSQKTVSFMEKIGELLKDGRNKLYISQYAMEMFSYYTIDKMEKDGAYTLSNYPINAANNFMYKAEAEYILWGNPNGQTDVNYTIASIFGVRFLLNTLYAFTGDPEIRHISLAMATAIAGWTGFGVPLVQSVIIIGFALAETANDMRQLLDGEDVPIYKSTSTWVIKPSTITKEAVQEAVNKTVEKGQEVLFDKLNQLTEETKEEFKTALQDYSNKTVDNILDTAIGNVINPMEKTMISLVNSISPSQEEIEAKIDEALTAAESGIVTDEDTVSSQISQLALEVFRSNYQSQLANKIYGMQKKAYDNAGIDTAELQTEIDTYFTSLKTNMENSLRTEAQTMVDALTKEVEDTLDSTNETIQENASDAIDKMMVRINGGINDIKETDMKIPDGGKGKTSGAVALTLNYKEYVSIFIALKCIDEKGEKIILRRIGDLVEANLVSSQTKPSPGFKISEAATMLELKASAEIKTTFFAMPVPMSGGGSKVLGQDSYSLSYKGVLGY